MARQTKRIQPTVNRDPAPQEAVPRILRRWSRQNGGSELHQEGGSERTQRWVAEADFGTLSAQRIQQVNLAYPADVRDSAESGLGCTQQTVA